MTHTFQVVLKPPVGNIEGTPSKTNITMEQQPFEDVSIIKYGDFLCHVIFSEGVTRKFIDFWSHAWPMCPGASSRVMMSWPT